MQLYIFSLPYQWTHSQCLPNWTSIYLSHFIISSLTLCTHGEKINSCFSNTYALCFPIFVFSLLKVPLSVNTLLTSLPAKIYPFTEGHYKCYFTIQAVSITGKIPSSLKLLMYFWRDFCTRLLLASCFLLIPSLPSSHWQHTS